MKLMLGLGVIVLSLVSAGRRLDDLYCNNQCRWYHGFYDRSIAGSRAYPWSTSCNCQQNGTRIGIAPFYTTDHSFAGPPTVPPNSLSGASCCEEGLDAPLANCTPTGNCHANTYANAKPFDNATWADAYTTPFVCVLPTSTSQFPESWRLPDSVHAACMADDDDEADAVCQVWRMKMRSNGSEVLHCGECSSCSSLHDLKVLERTKDYITTSMTACSSKFVLRPWWSVADLRACLVDAGIDFSEDAAVAWEQPIDRPSCMDTWTDNIINDATLCTRYCLAKFVDTANTGNFARDQCLQCDEYSSGPAFIKGAGANRRSTGIQSDIDRTQLKETPWEQKICKIGFFSGSRGSGRRVERHTT
mmetsp:Transcript_30204/g.78294  ORF Transcript_30204/g.78294 Transcript_30204/m.78294 type:complete len:360 (-) Transcript_30204:87-1166(-)